MLVQRQVSLVCEYHSDGCTNRELYQLMTIVKKPNIEHAKIYIYVQLRVVIVIKM